MNKENHVTMEPDTRLHGTQTDDADARLAQPRIKRDPQIDCGLIRIHEVLGRYDRQLAAYVVTDSQIPRWRRTMRWIQEQIKRRPLRVAAFRSKENPMRNGN